MSLPKRRKRERMNVRESSVIRCPPFLKFVRSHECSVTTTIIGELTCDGVVEAAHVRTGTDGGIGQKPSDCYALSLCSCHHREQHQIGEAAFQRKYGIDMRAIADGLWASWLKTTTGRKWKLEHGA